MTQFPPTRWSLIVKLRSGDQEEKSYALHEICSNYWAPLYNFLRIQGENREDAEDLVQSFFLQLLTNDSLAKISPADNSNSDFIHNNQTKLGTLRSYLLTGLKHHRTNTYRKKATLKRGANAGHLSIDHDYANNQLRDLVDRGLSPEQCFDRAWALNLIYRVTLSLQAEYEKRGKLKLFLSLEPLIAGGNQAANDSHAQIAEQLGVNPQAIRNGLHRLRRKLRDAIRAEVARTIDTNCGITVEEEITSLYSLLA